MKYVSERSGPPIASPNNGFWIRSDEIFDVSDDTHVQFMIRNPEKFNLTTGDICLLYYFHEEAVGSEKQAREDLVKIAASQGWIRVRHYVKPDRKQLAAFATEADIERRFVLAGCLV
jgi:hypothetical protein